VLCLTAWLGTAAGIVSFKAKEPPPIPTLRIPGLNIDVPLPFWGSLTDNRDPLDDTDEAKDASLIHADREVIRTPLSEKVSPMTLTPATLNLASLGFFLLAMTTMLSAFDRHRWRTIGIAVTIWVVMSIAKVVGMAVEDAAWLQYFSFFTPYSPEWAVYVGVRNPDDLLILESLPGPGERWFLSPLANNLILLGLGTVCYSVAATAFCNRDLPAPL
jgi:ABC-2 type transport system permease protein